MERGLLSDSENPPRTAPRRFEQIAAHWSGPNPEKSKRGAPDPTPHASTPGRTRIAQGPWICEAQLTLF